MTDDRHDHDHPLPDHLRWQLRALRKDLPPEADLWPGIAQRIADLPQQAVAAAPVRRDSRLRIALLATAASVLVALGIGWQLRPATGVPAAGTSLADGLASLLPSVDAAPTLPQAARAMTIEYRAALVELDAARTVPVRDPALRELDRSAAEVRTALSRDPQARFLLDRLQSVYARRLALTQRLALRA